MEKLKFCGLNFSGLSKNAILNSNASFQQIVTVGAEFIIEAHKNDLLKNIINENISTFDGQVPYFFAKLKNRNFKFEKISGADFIYDICKRAKEEKGRVYFLGGYEESNRGSVMRLRDAGVEADGFVTGFIPYPFPIDRLNEIRLKISQFNPTYLFVGLGMGKQEYFISENRAFLESCGVRIAIGCGGTMDVFSGRIKRAPRWMQKSGLESLYRVIKEPNMARFKRVLSTFKFLKYINE